jgi:hypothetical protein
VPANPAPRWIGDFGKCTIAEKTTIGSDQVEVGIKLLKIAEGVNGDGRTGDGFIERHRLFSGAFPTAYDPVSRKAGRLPSTCHIGCIQKPVNTGAAHGRSPFWRYRQAFRIFVEKRTLSNKVCNGHNCRQSWQLHRTELFSASQAATEMADYCDAARSSEMVAPFL